MAKTFLCVVNLDPVASLPGSGNKGDMVVLAGDGHLYVHNGTAWVDHGATGGGGGSIAQATLSVGAAVYGQADVSVAVGGVTSTSKVLAQLVPNAEWDADDLAEISVVPTPGAGVIVFSILRNGPIVGDFSVNYQVNA